VQVRGCGDCGITAKAACDFVFFGQEPNFTPDFAIAHNFQTDAVFVDSDECIVRYGVEPFFDLSHLHCHWSLSCVLFCHSQDLPVVIACLAICRLEIGQVIEPIWHPRQKQFSPFA
jgi:hypothetical protein